MAWLGLRLLLQEADVTQENVVGFPVDIIEQASPVSTTSRYVN